MRRAFLLFSLLISAACSNSPVSKALGAEKPREQFEFVLHDTVAMSDVEEIKIALDRADGPILDFLAVNDVPTVTIEVWNDEEPYQQTMEQTFGSRAPGSRGYVYGPETVPILLTGQPGDQSNAVHEFVHAVTLHMNPGFGNNPRWVWEAVAQYLAGEVPSPKAARHFENGNCPTLETLSSPFDRGGKIYESGYLLGDFIVQLGGQAALNELIFNEGDISTTLSLSEAEFEAGWCEFARSYFRANK